MKTLLLTFVGALLSCGPGGGNLTVTIYGEKFIEDEIPADTFADGWQAKFTKYLVNVGEITAARGHESPDLTAPEFKVYDLTKSSGGEGHKIITRAVKGGAYDHVSYHLAAATQASSVGNASESDRKLMADNGYALYLSRLARAKGVDDLIAGFTRSAACHDRKLVIAGDGPDAQHLQELAAARSHFLKRISSLESKSRRVLESKSGSGVTSAKRISHAISAQASSRSGQLVTGCPLAGSTWRRSKGTSLQSYGRTRIGITCALP